MITADTREAPTAIWLPDFTREALAGTLHREADGERFGYLDCYGGWLEAPDDDNALNRWCAALDATTSWLWSAVMAPVVEHLESAKCTRATFVPHGLLGMLPLHAAWASDPDTPNGRRYAIDRLAINYTPNARALLHAQRLAGQTAPVRLLIVDAPTSVDGPPLIDSSRETAAAVATFARHRRLSGAAATREAVLAGLQECDVAHLCCHAYSDYTDPLNSGLSLAHDDSLTVRDVMALRLPGLRLAILSACETSVRGMHLPDEAVGLPSGLLQAGVAGVIGSLWCVADDSTTMLMERFHRLLKDESDPVLALATAQRWLRDSEPAGGASYRHPFWWAGFQHTGA